MFALGCGDAADDADEPPSTEVVADEPTFLIAGTGYGAGNQRTIQILDAFGAPVREVEVPTLDGRRLGGLRASPDGSLLIASTSDDQAARISSVVIDPAGSVLAEVPEAECVEWLDDDTLLISVPYTDGTTVLTTTEFDGQSRVVATLPGHLCAAGDGDGGILAVSSPARKDGSPTKVLHLEAGSSTPTEVPVDLTDCNAMVEGGVGGDGLLAISRTCVEPAGSPDSGGGVDLVDFDTGERTEISQEGLAWPSWSPDRSTLLAWIGSPMPNHGAWLMNADGSDAHRVTQQLTTPTLVSTAWG